jgi:transcriptional regulator with XRE-family HTH domain
MGQVAAGAYLESLRLAHKKSRADVARAIGPSESQIQRIEAGEIDTRSSLLFSFARYVKANFARLAELLLADADSEAEGIRLAESMTDEELQEAIQILGELRGDPTALHRWLGYGRGLSDDRRDD